MNRTGRPLLAAALAAALAAGAAGAREPSFEPALGVDRLTQALDMVGFDRSDLGVRPKAYWSRFPRIDRIPHILPFLPELLAEPLETYGFVRVMAGALEEHLDPGYRGQRPNAMFKVVHFLGVEKKVVGPRGYDYAIDFATFSKAYGGGPAEAAADLAAALEHLHRSAGAPFDAGRLREAVSRVPTALHPPLTALLAGLEQACRWHGTAFHGVDPGDRTAALERRPLHEKDYAPELDRISRDLDAVSLYHAAQLAVSTVERASRDLAEAGDRLLEMDRAFGPIDLPTPLGRIVVAGAGNDRHGDCGDCLALVDLGGDDVYDGSVGAAFDRPVSVALDLAGDDRYLAPPPGRPTQGAGLLGVGVLLDVAGNDRYEAESIAQGLGFFGLGLLWDDEGDDTRRLRFSGQGAAYFGIGLLVDGAGDDVYDLWGDGQGFGGIGGGVGVLADRSGDDRYTAEIDAHVTGRGSGHTRKRVTYSNAQGAANGRRGDLSDGHAWAGGLGALLDLEGDDAYEAGNWALGAGYWFGAGILYDGGGNDRYRSVYYSLASGAHFCLGAVFDDGDGDDTYTVWDPPIADDLVPPGLGMNAAAGAGLSFAWDFCVSLLVDKGGDDTYTGRIISGARAMIRSTAILADLGRGDDIYTLPGGAGGGSAASSYHGPADTLLSSFLVEYTPASQYGTNFAFLLDAGGADRYRSFDDDGAHTPHPLWADGRTWQQPPPDAEDYGNDSYGIGMDVEGGTIHEFHRFQRQQHRR